MLPCFWGCWQSGVPWPGEALPTFAPGVLASQPQACCVAPARCPPCDLPILHSPWMPSSQNQPHSQSEGQGPPWAPRESPAKSMSAKPATPLQDGGLRPRRVVPFAVVNMTHVRCVQASVSGSVQEGQDPRVQVPPEQAGRAGRQGPRERSSLHSRDVCPVHRPSQPFPGPSQTSGPGTQPKLVVFHSGD